VVDRTKECPHETNRCRGPSSDCHNTFGLSRVWADDLTFTNPLGVVQTKAERLAEIRSGGRKLDAVDIDDIQVRVYGETAVVTSRSDVPHQDAVTASSRGTN
jgi:hypothetical protein